MQVVRIVVVIVVERCAVIKFLIHFLNLFRIYAMLLLL